MENDTVKNIVDYNTINSTKNFSTVSLLILIENVYNVCLAKGIEIFDGLPLGDWKNSITLKVGVEPILRILFRIIFACTEHQIFLVEILNKDPVLFIECVNRSDLTDYYEKYPEPIGVKRPNSPKGCNGSNCIN